MEVEAGGQEAGVGGDDGTEGPEREDGSGVRRPWWMGWLKRNDGVVHIGGALSWNGFGDKEDVGTSGAVEATAALFPTWASIDDLECVSR